ncbi:minor tail protein [Streptomyces phage Yosif]|uniref:Minor tail protein n=1 Tax=Streptomyces phage Yosif TaxID=2201421 RepID=A0A2Z4QD38_9CAUD|nr:tail protein [Streptomyces phage Yosif]AWY07590.1 minor tail protein [Streptomyces phage Yosif]
MAQSSYPFDGQSVTESQFSQFFRELQDSGVCAQASDLDLRTSADGTGMKVIVQPGKAIVRGHAYASTAVETLTIAAADTAARTDRIVLRLDPTANSITLQVLKGAPGAGVPALTQTDTGIYELLLANVTVPASATSISSANVDRQRHFVGHRIGHWETGQRPTNPRQGKLGYNFSTNKWEFWNGSAWVDLAPTVDWNTIAGKPGTFPAETHTHDYNTLTNKPTSFPASAHSHDWASITGKPSTFAPASHSHSWSSITSKPSTFPPSSHSHSNYLTSGETISWANGTKRVHNDSVSGSGTYYAVWVQGDGTFARNTSSIKFKENVRDYPIDPAAVLALRPVMYDRKATVNDEGETVEGRKDEFGLIAEEVNETIPEIVNILDGEVDGLRYDLLGVALLSVVKHQEERIARLEKLVEELTQ